MDEAAEQETKPEGGGEKSENETFTAVMRPFHYTVFPLPLLLPPPTPTPFPFNNPLRLDVWRNLGDDSGSVVPTKRWRGSS